MHGKKKSIKGSNSTLTGEERGSRGPGARLARAAMLAVPAAAAALAFRGSPVRGGTDTWNGGRSFQGNNWGGGSAPGGNSNNGNNDLAIIPSGLSTTIDLFNSSNTVHSSG